MEENNRGGEGRGGEGTEGGEEDLNASVPLVLQLRLHHWLARTASHCCGVSDAAHINGPVRAIQRLAEGKLTLHY
jgi:hypothetical protein